MKESGHFYDRDGTPRFQVPYKDPSKGMRPTTLADARKLGLLPSVTTLLNVLAKPALVQWKCNQAALAVATTPRLENEPLDDFIERCLSVDAESESDAAKQLGTDIHDAIEKSLSSGEIIQNALTPFIAPVLAKIGELGRMVATEKIVVGDYYAGTLDAIVENDEFLTVLDFKSTKAKKLPANSYPEHLMQLAAYAKTLGNTGAKRIRTANIYISTIRAGEFSLCVNDDWQNDYLAFEKVAQIWQWINEFKMPEQKQMPIDDGEIVP